MQKSSLSVIAATAALMAACATAPRNSPAVDEARARIEGVAADPLASEAAAPALDAAQQDLKRAQQALTDREPERTVDHFAYLANRNAEIAAELIGERRARLAVEQGQADRDRILLEARTREAERARADADRARAAADSARSEALGAAAESEKLREELTALQAKPTDRGMVLTLGDVLFDTARAQLKPGAIPTIERVAAFMREHDSYQLLVEGHTDSVGNDDYNVELSQRRADAVREALMTRGVDSDRVRVRGLGKSFPVADNGTAAGRQQNRRVEVVFSDEEGHFAAGGKDRTARAGT